MKNEVLVCLTIKTRHRGFYEPSDRIKDILPEEAVKILMSKYCNKGVLEKIGEDFEYVAEGIDKWLTTK